MSDPIRHDRRIEILYVLLVLAVCVVTWLLNAQANGVNRDSYRRCEDRTANIDKANRFYREMAVLEAGNRFIDEPLRRARVTLYRAEVLALPHCGSP